MNIVKTLIKVAVPFCYKNASLTTEVDSFNFALITTEVHSSSGRLFVLSLSLTHQPPPG